MAVSDKENLLKCVKRRVLDIFKYIGLDQSSFFLLNHHVISMVLDRPLDDTFLKNDSSFSKLSSFEHFQLFYPPSLHS